MVDISLMNKDEPEYKNENEKDILEEQKKNITEILDHCRNFSVFETEQELAIRLKLVYDLIYEFIETKKCRFLYSVVSTYVYYLKDQEEENLQNFMENLVQYVEQGSKKYEKTGKAIIKLWDHINLALAQEMYIKNKHGVITSFTKDLENRVSYVDNRLWEVSGKVEKILTQMISIVSIFTAISFVIFGGISSFQSILGNIEKVPLIKLMIISCVWAFALVNLLFLFIYYIAKLIGKEIKTTYHLNANLVQRYPYIIYINLAIFTIFIISVWLKIIEMTTDINIFVSLINKNVILISVLFIAFLIATWFYISKKSKKTIIDKRI